MALNALVFPCGSEIGLEIHAALKYSKVVRVYGASSVSDHGEFVYARYRQIGAHAASADFIEQLNQLIDEWKIDIVLPAHDSAIPVLAQHRSELRAAAMVPDAETAALCRNKNLTYARLRPLGIVPANIDGATPDYPIFAKPAVGQGSQGAERVDSAERHRQLRDSPIEYVFSEYLPGAEYTVDCISDHAGALLHAAPRMRSRIKGGISVRTEPAAADPSIEAMAVSIAAELRLQGAWFFQARRDAHGVPKLLEVAPRIAGSMALSRNLGVNYPLLSIYAHLNMPFSVCAQNYPIQMDRALHSRFRTGLRYERVYLDLDDTVIIDDRVNPLLMALLYQWSNRGVKVSLLTRHARCPRQTLAHYRISAELFDEILHIEDGAPKSQHITHVQGALFIDDSYRERRDVLDTHGIPVFDVDAIEQLLEWRA